MPSSFIGVVYQYKNNLDGKVYVGSTNNQKRRHQQHIRELRNNIHKNPKFQNAWNVHKEHNFAYSILEVIPDCTKTKLLVCEQKHLDSLNETNSYNLAWIAGSCAGVKRSKETKQKLSAVNIGKTLTETHKQSIAASKTGLKQTEEHTRNMANGHKGQKFTEGHKENLLLAQKNKKAVVQLLKDGTVVSEYPSVRKASRETGIALTSIRTALKNSNRSAGGCFWTHRI